MIKIRIERQGNFYFSEVARVKTLRCRVVTNDDTGKNGVKMVAEFQREMTESCYLSKLINEELKQELRTDDYRRFGMELAAEDVGKLVADCREWAVATHAREKAEARAAHVETMRGHYLFTTVKPKLEADGFTVTHTEFETMWDAALTAEKDGQKVWLHTKGQFWCAEGGSKWGDTAMEKRFKRVTEAVEKVESVHSSLANKASMNRSILETARRMGEGAARSLPFKVTVEVKEDLVHNAWSKRSSKVINTRLITETGRKLRVFDSNGEKKLSLEGGVVLPPEKMARVLAILDEK